MRAAAGRRIVPYLFRTGPRSGYNASLMPDPELPPNPAAAASPLPLSEPPPGALRTIFFIVFMDLLGFGIIIPLLPRYVPHYAEHPLKVTLIFSIYSICQFIGSPILGMISDRYGRRPVLALSQVGSAIGYVLLGVATDWGRYTLALIYLSRVIDGFTGGNISTAQAYVSDVTTPQNRSKGMGMIGAAFGIGFSFGPAIGGILGHYHVSWPAYLAAILAMLAAIQSWRKLPETRTHKPTDSEVWLHPGRFLPILRHRVLLQLLIISFLIMAAFVMMESTLVIYLAKPPFNFTVWGTGWYFFYLGMIIILVQGGLIGRLTKRLGEWPLCIAGPVLVTLGMIGFTWTAVAPLLPLLLLAGAVNAIGRSIQQPSISSLISKFSDRRQQGTVFGLFHGLASLARVAGPIAAGLAYPYLRNTGQFVIAGGVAIAVAAWTALLRTPVPAGAEPEAMAEAALEVA